MITGGSALVIRANLRITFKSKWVISIEEGERTIGAKAFQFKLKSVLEIRERQLEEVQNRFAVQQHRVLDITTMLAETQAEIKQQLIASPEEVVDPVLSQQRFRYLQYLKMQVDNLRETLRKEEQILNVLREEMRQAHIRKRSLELLEEKQRKVYVKTIEDQEMKEMEDLVIARQHRARK